MRKYIFAAAILLGLPVIASAHAIGQVYALPVPLKYYLGGAALAVAVSFFILGIFLKKNKLDRKK